MTKKSVLLSLFLISFLSIGAIQLLVLPASVRANQAPLTSPVTPPLTSFVLKISGKITIKQIRFTQWFSRRVPAEGVTVKLLNTTTKTTQSVQTDTNGVYTFSVDGKGWYKVTPQITNSTADIVAPPFRFVLLNKRDKLHEDFQAIDLP